MHREKAPRMAPQAATRHETPTTQHTPKTIVRRSPSESTRKVNAHSDDTTFQYILGISNRQNSVWSPYAGQKMPKSSNPIGRPNENGYYYDGVIPNGGTRFNNLPLRASADQSNYGYYPNSNNTLANTASQPNVGYVGSHYDRYDERFYNQSINNNNTNLAVGSNQKDALLRRHSPAYSSSSSSCTPPQVRTPPGFPANSF